MRKIEHFTNQYPVQKTLRFKLIPVGETEENYRVQHLLEKDKELAKSYIKMKECLDRFYQKYIEGVLSKVHLSGLNEYAELYYRADKTEDQRKAMADLESKLREQISDALKKDGEDLFKGSVLKRVLTELTDPEELRIAHVFDKFSTYLYGFFEKRKNMFSEEAKSTGVANRCITDNLPRFLDNSRNAKKIFAALADKMGEIGATYEGLFGVSVEEMFTVDYFSFVLSQGGISKYNQTIGGYTTEDGTKVQGLNEWINLYNQVHPKEKIPKFKTLYKQILSAEQTVSYIPESFSEDQEVLDAIRTFYSEELSSYAFFEKLDELIEQLSNADLGRIYVKNDAKLTQLNVGVFGRWDAVVSGWNDEYDRGKKNNGSEKYLDSRRKAFKAVPSFSFAEIERYGRSKRVEDTAFVGICEWVKSQIGSEIQEVRSAYQKAEILLTRPYTDEKKLPRNGEAIALIKTLLDDLKTLEHTMELLLGTGKEEAKDDTFYGEYLPLYDRLAGIDRLYDKVRNYVTQKPFKTKKIKLNFENAQFLGGWDQNKESEYSAVLFTRGNDYFIGVMPRTDTRSFEEFPLPQAGEAVYKKMIYKLLPGPNKMLPKVFFSRKGLETYKPDEKILRIYTEGTFKKGDGFSLDDCHCLIDFYKEKIREYPGWDVFDFKFLPTESYGDIGEFYRDVKNQGYKVVFTDVPASYIDGLVREGKLFLFKIYNKDFSEYSKGTPNLHTLYFRTLFDPANLTDVKVALNGGAEMFYREASIRDGDRTIHPANMPIKNKNPNNPNRESTFTYDLIKNKRYTHDQFMLHIPITLNFTANGNTNINEAVNGAIQSCENNYVIGIDRGERNLIYISVVDEQGRIVEQYSLNEIISEYRGGRHTVDYHALLDRKEEDRQDARKNWTTIEAIKDLKEGYISQVVHKICELVRKYDAVIAMEDLNFGFKNSRGAVEKSVYQKFEKMLIDKLNFYVVKGESADSVGGIFKAFQLTNKFESFAKMGKQNGFIFYVPAWLTSKIDPTTGFVDLLYPRYESVDAAKAFFGKFDRIRYSKEKDRFEFSFDYGNFNGGSVSYRKKWTICSAGKRIETRRDPQNNFAWMSKEVDLTERFKALFEQYGISLDEDLKVSILERTEKDFFVRLIGCLKLVLQMRNSTTGTDIDYLISPVENAEGAFYCSDDYHGVDAILPVDADANGAYNIARKAQMLIALIKKTPTEGLRKVKLAISNAEWLEYVQR